MKVIFESVVKEDGIGGWYIELRDTVDNRVENCKDLEEYAVKIEEMGNDYGGHIDEVKWSHDKNVTPQHLYEVRMGMQKYQEELNNGADD